MSIESWAEQHPIGAKHQPAVHLKCLVKMQCDWQSRDTGNMTLGLVGLNSLHCTGAKGTIEDMSSPWHYVGVGLPHHRPLRFTEQVVRSDHLEAPTVPLLV